MTTNRATTTYARTVRRTRPAAIGSRVERAIHTALSEVPEGTSVDDVVETVYLLVGTPIPADVARTIGPRIEALR